MADDEESRPLTSNGRESSGNNNGRNTRNGNITPSAEYGTVSSRHSSSDVGSASGGNNGGNGAHRLTDDNVYDEPGRKELPSNNTAGGDVVAAALEAVEKDPDANIHNPRKLLVCFAYSVSSRSRQVLLRAKLLCGNCLRYRYW